MWIEPLLNVSGCELPPIPAIQIPVEATCHNQMYTSTAAVCRITAEVVKGGNRLDIFHIRKRSGCITSIVT